MLDSDLDVITYYEFKKLSFKPKEHPNLAKGAIWDQLLEQGVVRTGIIRGKTSKERPGAFIPKFTFSRKHGDVCPQPPLDSVRMSFEEEHDVGLATRRGRQTAEHEEIRAKYQSIIRKLDDHEQVKPCPPMSDDLVGLLNRLVTDRASVLQQMGLHIVEGKEIINTVLNGGNPPASLKSHDIVRGLQRMSQYFRWMACNLLHDDYMSLAENKQKTFPSSTIMSLMWTSVEDVILRSWTEHVLQNPNKPGHLSLHFAGIRVSADHMGASQEDYIKACQDAIYKHTGFQ
ncbi:pim1, partial [Symbiodinium sp. CCMP2456]